MARQRLTNTKSITHNAETIDGVKEVSYEITGIEKRATSDGEGTQRDVIGFEVRGEVRFDSTTSEDQAFLANANLVVRSRIQGGAADRLTTIKNVQFLGSRGSIPGTDTQDMATWTMPFVASPGPSDTRSTMVEHSDPP